MELFIKVYFWVALFAIVLKTISVGILPYPRETERWEDALAIIIGMFFAGWAMILLWG
jgi:hypothetical protein